MNAIVLDPTQSGPSAALPAEAVRAQVARVVASEVFRRADRQCRFLRYIVDHSLAGTTDRLKGYTIGLDVFDRDANFDPNLDSIVRVEAGRLRTKLRDYYQDPGRQDSILIDLPRGAYAPAISRREDKIVPLEERAARPAVKGSVAVLPFRNLSGDSEQEYFSDGLTDMVITALARNRQLKVISLTSVMRYKLTQRSIPDISAELNVGHVLEGTVLRDGSQVRISAQLIEAVTDHHVWADAFERDMAGTFRVQRDLADLICAQLVRELAPDGAPELQSPVRPDAYEMYLLGRGYRRRMTREGIEKASECFKKAISLDMGFAAAYAGAASCYCALGSYGFELKPPEELIPAGLEYSRRAMEMDPAQIESIVFTGIMTLKYLWDWKEAERLFKLALATSPNDTRARVQYSLYFESIGAVTQAIDEAELARQIDPLSTEANMNLAWQLHQAGRDEEALSRLLWTLDLNPGFWGAHWGLGHVLLTLGRPAEAIDAFQKSVATGSGYAMPLQGLGYAHGVTGNRKAAMGVITQLEEMGRSAYVSPCCRAAIHAGLGDADNCFSCLEHAFKLRSRSLAWLNVAEEYAGLRMDPRFADLVRRIGIPALTQATSEKLKVKSDIRL